MSRVPTYEEKYEGEVEELKRELRVVHALAADLVDTIVGLLRDREDDTIARPDDHPIEPLELARQAAAALNADRERTGVDEWDESDQRCELMNLADEVLERPR